MHSQKGSITIFALLSMLLIMSILLSMLEATRYQAIKGMAQLQTQTTLESAFANYSSVLWEKYHLLACNEEELQNSFVLAKEARSVDWSNRLNLLSFQNKETEVIKHMRLTDGEGLAYIQVVSAYMEKNLLYETAKEIYNQYNAVKELKDSSEFNWSNVDKAIEKLEQEDKKKKEDTTAATSVGTSKKMERSVINPLEEVTELKRAGILNLVLKDTECLSKAEIELEDTVSHRKLKKGNMDMQKGNWLNRVWLQQYFLTYLSHYGQELDGHHLAYELEYLIGGKENDAENLKVAITELLMLRSLCNFTYLISDKENMEEARILAIALAGANPALVEVVKVGIITAWAFGESVLDVRALLQGKKVALLKSKTLWSLDFEQMTAINDEYWMAKESKDGLSYKDYLGLLLILSSQEKLAMRSMDVQEATLRTQYGNTDLKLDEYWTQAEITMTYGYKPVFSSMENIDNAKMWNYEVMCRKVYGY